MISNSMITRNEKLAATDVSCGYNMEKGIGTWREKGNR